MIKILKLLMIILMILGIALSIINLISVDNMAIPSVSEGSAQNDGCYGPPLNC